MFLGPIVTDELTRIARRKRWYVLRVLLGLALLWFIWASYSTSSMYVYRPGGQIDTFSHVELRAIASRVFIQLAYCQGVIIFFLAPLLTAGAIAEEKQRKTLHYLLASELSSIEIVMGKLVSRLFLLVMPILIGMPVMAMLGMFGGTDLPLFLMGYAVIAMIAVFEASFAIMISVLARRGREALLMTMLLLILLMIVPAIVESSMFGHIQGYREFYQQWIEPWNEHLFLLSPLSLLRTRGASNLSGGTSADLALSRMFWHQGIAAILFLLIAIWQLRPAFRRQDGAPARGPKLWRTLRTNVRRWLPRRPVGDDALIWKEIHGTPGSTLLTLISWATILVALILSCDSMYRLIPNAWAARVAQFPGGTFNNGYGPLRELNVMLRVTITGLFSVMAMLLGCLAATSISREREDDTWISLISAPIEGREILRAKMIGTFLGLKTLIGAIAITLLFGFVMGVISLAGVLISLVQIVIFMAFIVILGTLISLRAKTTMRAIGTTLGILLALSILGPMILSAFNFHRGYYMFTWITCMPFHVAGGMIPDWEIPQIFNELGRESYSQIGRSAPVIIVGTLMFGAASLALHSLSKTVCDRLLDRPRRSVGLVKNAGPAATCSSESQASQAE